MGRPTRSADSAQSWFVLDAARALAALFVLVAHARDFTLADAADQPALPLAGKAFYALAGLGHQAVVVFFVISGFLVTRSMMRLDAAGRWSLGVFATARLTRLWIVLVPCLMIGAVFDRIGIAASGSPAETAHYGVLALASHASPPALDLLTFLGNVAFLQTIAVQSYGSNGALWSLANEAWYYAVAALLFGAFRARSSGFQTAAHLAAAGAIFTALPRSMWELAPVWAFGATLAFSKAREPAGKRTARPWLTRLAAGALFVATLGAARARWGHPAVLDDALGAATAWLLWSTLPIQVEGGRAVRAVRRLSHASYSLYLSHCPLLAIVTTLSMGPRHRAFGGIGLLFIAIEIGLALLLAAAVWWLFERRTAAVRRFVERWSKTNEAYSPVLGRASHQEGATS